MSDVNYREIRVPPLGESVSEATIARWAKRVGEFVQADELIVELETDKVTLEVTAPASGVLHMTHYGVGDTVQHGAILGTIHMGAVATPGVSEASVSLDAVTAAPISMPITAAPTPQPTAPLPGEFSPSVTRMVAEHQLDPAVIPASGLGGRLTKDDVVNYMDQRGGVAPVSEPVSSQPSSVGFAHQRSDEAAYTHSRQTDRQEERVRMSQLRRRIAERLKHAQNTAAILTTFNEVDMTAINKCRAAYKDKFEKKHGIKLGFMSFFVKAAIQALREYPAVNAEIDGDEVVYKNFYDIGVAVSAPQGLVVPVVRHAHLLSIADIEKEIASLGQKARDGKLTRDNMSGGTFTISNGGIFGSLMSTPILNAPQTGILGMHKVQDRPVAINGAVEIRPMMYIALSYDHRLIDGREAVGFLVRVKENVENPERLLLEV